MTITYTPNSRIQPDWLAEALSIWKSSDFHNIAPSGHATICPMFKKFEATTNDDEDLPYTSLEIAATAAAMEKLRKTNPKFHLLIHNGMRRGLSNVNETNANTLSIACQTLADMIDDMVENGLDVHNT